LRAISGIIKENAIGPKCLQPKQVLSRIPTLKNSLITVKFILMIVIYSGQCPKSPVWGAVSKLRR
jgi:hypothetical protein